MATTPVPARLFGGPTRFCRPVCTQHQCRPRARGTTPARWPRCGPRWRPRRLLVRLDARSRVTLTRRPHTKKKQKTRRVSDGHGRKAYREVARRRQTSTGLHAPVVGGSAGRPLAQPVYGHCRRLWVPPWRPPRNDGGSRPAARVVAAAARRADGPPPRRGEAPPTVAMTASRAGRRQGGTSVYAAGRARGCGLVMCWRGVAHAAPDLPSHRVHGQRRSPHEGSFEERSATRMASEEVSVSPKLHRAAPQVPCRGSIAGGGCVWVGKRRRGGSAVGLPKWAIVEAPRRRQPRRPSAGHDEQPVTAGRTGRACGVGGGSGGGGARRTWPSFWRGEDATPPPHLAPLPLLSLPSTRHGVAQALRRGGLACDLRGAAQTAPPSSARTGTTQAAPPSSARTRRGPPPPVSFVALVLVSTGLARPCRRAVRESAPLGAGRVSAEPHARFVRTHGAAGIRF